MCSKEIFKLVFTALTSLFVFWRILNRLIYNLIDFPSWQGGVARAVILYGPEIGSRAGVVEVNLMVIISRLKKTKQGTSFLRVSALLYFDLKTGWYFRILNT